MDKNEEYIEKMISEPTDTLKNQIREVIKKEECEKAVNFAIFDKSVPIELKYSKWDRGLLAFQDGKFKFVDKSRLFYFLCIITLCFHVKI